MAELSPQAQAVLDAATERWLDVDDDIPAQVAVAALLAAADQVAPEDFAYDSGSLADGALEFEQGQDCRNKAIRQHILAIADELENADDHPHQKH